MAGERKFSTATATASGLAEIEVFYNSYNKILRDEVAFYTENGTAIYLDQILKAEAKNKDLASLNISDFREDVLPKTGSSVDNSNATLLLNLLKREKVNTAPHILHNGVDVAIAKAHISAQTVYFRLEKSTDVIDVRSILQDTSKNKNLEEITLEDVKPEFIPHDPTHYESLIKLINGQELSSDDIVELTYNGKVVVLENTMYVKQGVATEATVEVGKEDTSSLRREYYTAISTASDKSPHYVESKQTIPPAYKKSGTLEENIDEETRHQIFAGQQVKLDGVISYQKEDGTIGYRKNQEIALRDGILYAVPEGWKVNPEGERTPASIEEHAGKRVKLGEIKTSNVVGGFKGKVEKKYDVAHDQFKINIDGKSHIIYCYSDHFVLGRPPRDNQIIFATEDYPMARSTGRVTFRVKSYQYNYNPDTNDFSLDISFVDNVIKNPAKLTSPLGDIADAENKDEIISSKLVCDNYGKVKQIKSVLSASGEEESFDLSDIAGINFNPIATTQFVSDSVSYKPAPMFDYKRDEHGEIVYKKDADGNDLLDESGNKIPEEKVLNSDLIQTSKVSDDGDLTAFNFEENDKLVKEFEEEVQLLQQELVKLKASPDKDKNVDKIKELKQKLDKKLEKLKEIKDETSIKSVNKLIEDYQNGEFFETFFFENGEMFEIKDGKKISLSSNSSLDYSNLLNDIVGNYTVKNNKGKCQVVLGETATNIIGGSLKIAEVLYSASLAPSFLSLIAMPFALTIGTGCLAFAGGTAVVNVIRNKIKQAQLNSLTPEKIRNKLNKNLEKETKKDIKLATKKYNQERKRINKYVLNEEEKEKKLEEAKKNFVAQRAKIVGRLNLLEDLNIESKYSVKDKKITNANIIGFAEYRKQKKAIKKGLPLDEGTKFEYDEAKKKAKEERDKKLKLLDKKSVAEKHKIQKAYKVAVGDIKNKYLSQFGSLKGLHDREYYLKKTQEYLTADDATRKQMIEDCRKAMKGAKELKEVGSSSMPAKKTVGKDVSSLYKYVVEHSPKGKKYKGKDGKITHIDAIPMTNEEEAVLLELEENARINVSDREKAKTEKTSTEKRFEGIVPFVEKVNEADKEVETHPDKAPQLIEELKDATKGKAQEMRQKEVSKQKNIDRIKHVGQEKKNQEKEQLSERRKQAVDEAKSIMNNELKDNNAVQEIVKKGDLTLYARVYFKENGLADTSDEEKILVMLQDWKKGNVEAKTAQLRRSKKFLNTFEEVCADKNSKLIGELVAEDSIYHDLMDPEALQIMSQAFVGISKKNGDKITPPRFVGVVTDSAGNKTRTPQYRKSERNNLLLKRLKTLDREDAKKLFAQLQKSSMYQDYLARKNDNELNL